MFNFDLRLKEKARGFQDYMGLWIWQRFYGKRLVYLIEDRRWSIMWDGINLTEELRKRYGFSTRVMAPDILKHFRKTILHFGSKSAYCCGYNQEIDGSNFVVLSYFHVMEEDRSLINFLKGEYSGVDMIHTSCEMTKKELVKRGIFEGRIIVIPIGIRLDSFGVISEEEKIRRREGMGIPVDRVVIGSFQKDGEGWGEGDVPKLIKGPDVFCDVVEGLASRHRIYVLLTGPGRGYVKKRLKDAGIPFQHIYEEDYRQMGRYFSVLDLYIIASRVEGGPKALLEGLASGVGMVSTRVGMAEEVLEHGESGFLADIEDRESLIYFCGRMIEDRGVRDYCVRNGLRRVKEYDLSEVARRYCDEIYFGFEGFG